MLAAAISILGRQASAVTLVWDNETWTAGSLSNSYHVDPNQAGNNITVGVSGSTGQLQPENIAPNPMTPANTTDLQGGLAAAHNSLCLAVNFTDQSQFITVTVTLAAGYTAGANNVSFTIFDVDFANNNQTNSHFQDQIRAISALSIDGTTLIAPTITTSAFNTASGTGLNQMVTGNATSNDTGAGSGNGNVTISFGTNAIKSFTFTWGSGSGTIADPTYQHIGLYNIDFTPVPEMNPAWSALASCLVAGGLVLRHRSMFRRR